MSSVVPGPGGMTWTIGECGCGRTTWTVDRASAGALMSAVCECGERRELRLAAGPSVAPPEPVTFTFAEFGSPLLERVKLGPWRREVVASSPEGMKPGPSVIDRTFEWWMEQTRDLAAEHKAQVQRDIAALDPRCPTKTVAEVAAERGYGTPEGWVAPVMGCGRLVEVMVDWGPPVRGRVTVMDDDDALRDFDVEHFDERRVPLGSQVDVCRGRDGVQRVFLQERDAHPQSAVGLLLAMPGVVEAEVRADRHTGAWHITYRGGPSPTVIRQALREAFPKQPFTVGRQGDAHPGTAASFMDAAMSGCVTVLYRGDVSPAAVRSAVEEEKPFGCSLIVERDREEYALPSPPAPFGQFSVPSPEDFSDPTDYFRKQKALRLSKLAEAQAAAKTRTTAKLLHAAERHSNPSVRDIARVELLARAAEAARPPDIRDEWDNLEDVEPEGIVPRGAK